KACEKYPILQQGDRGVLGPGPVEITIYRTPDRHWVKHVCEYVVEFGPSGQSETVYAESYEEMLEPDAIREVRAAGFKIPPRPAPPRLTASKKQRASRQGTAAGRLSRGDAEPREFRQDAVMCSQAQVARFLDQAECGGLIKRLEKQGVLSSQTRLGGKFSVVFANQIQHVSFRSFVNKELQDRRAKCKNRSQT